MQKIQSYLYSNRVILLADLAGFTVENTVVYAKTVKIYKGVDNVIEFDIQNADQKRLDLLVSPSINTILMNVFDASGKALPTSPYPVTPTSITGVASATIPFEDLINLQHQMLRYSVTAIQGENLIPLYTDSRFSAVGTLDLVGSAVPTTRTSVAWDRFQGEINFFGNVTNHSSAIQAKFYEAVPTTSLNITVTCTNFVGNIYIEGTEDSTISVESFKNAAQIQSYSTSVATTTTYTFTNVPVGNNNYLRVSWQYPSISPFNFTNTNPYGTVDKVVVSYN